MKLRLLAMMLLGAGFMACSSDENDYVEYWTVNIEPEYVLGVDYWGGYTFYQPAMRATNDEGTFMGSFLMGQIKGFDYEEGYRYKLKIEAKDILASLEDKGIYFADIARYDFTLKEVLKKEYVGIREEGRRDLEMDVQLVHIRSVNDLDSWGYDLLSGTVVGTEETIFMNIFEIYGLDDPTLLFHGPEYAGLGSSYRVRMKVSITPSDSPVYYDVYRRIRLQEIVSKEEVESDSIIYMNRDEAEHIIFGQ